MLSLLFLLIFVFLLFYYKAYKTLLAITIILIMYSAFLYNCFYDNKIISSWLEKQTMSKIETINFELPEFIYVINTDLILIYLFLFLSVLFFVFKIFFRP